MTNAERQKAYRLRLQGVTENVTENVTGVTERNAETVTALRERVTDLEGEVARLKRQLAEANTRPPVFHPSRPAVSGLLEAEQAVRRIEAGHRSPIKKSAESPKGSYTPHGGLCQCIGCRAGGMR